LTLAQPGDDLRLGGDVGAREVRVRGEDRISSVERARRVALVARHAGRHDERRTRAAALAQARRIIDRLAIAAVPSGTAC
jgi:hypothetical protein